MKQKTFAGWLKREWGSLLLLFAALLLFLAVRAGVTPEKDGALPSGDYVEYEKGVVTAVLSDSTEADEASDGAFRGEQMMTVEVKSGQYKGESLLVNNYVGPLYGVPLSEGDGVALLISTYKDGNVRANVFEYNRIPALIAIVALFFLVTAVVGGRTGLKSLLGLAFTILCLMLLLLPLLLRGAPTLPTVFLMCAYITVVCFTILGGLHRKSLCAMLGTIAGVALAMGFGLFAQEIARVDGLRMSDVEPLLQLRQAGTPIGLRGLLVAGILISALGAVMDVAMSISSALEEVYAANPSVTHKDLFRSGMNIGRDMVGTMTNTLILAFLGSGFTLILYLFSLGLSTYQFFPSAYLAMEVISGISCSIGMILAIPLTALISAFLLTKKK